MRNRTAERRVQLVRAAHHVFSAQGYRNTGVSDIVREAGVSHGTFYNYFDNKRHILDEVLDSGVDFILNEVVGADEPDDASTSGELAAQFRAILTRVFALVEREPGLVQFILLDAPAIDDESLQRLLRLVRTFGATASAFLANGVRRGFLRSDLDTEIAGEGLLSLIISAILTGVRGGLSPEERDRTIEAFVGFAMTGVR
ncbi:TetR/AcrR family transcriptional regulator [Amycolatopsis magusensis]|uniref:AcrR family transcriptional regulator n=1 Tax=Amycolatopsis magusensis TaxID=882444 RepID=A0ABS4PLR4_9PSEU|nr:TetR/AcrR family transcriptional regulator [Amycolatopsis magusensis]MBP2180351.1 AcrR family transcriptional regulator [Amycolatopsis magusensis]MDI5977762.1 TetR/AcrR family transcriptional regulator [Amycolatopsis magusensis]